MAADGRRYHVQHVLGRGGFGTVYLAEMTSGGGFAKPVALKVLNEEMGEMAEVAQRLRDEARLLGRLKHPAILRVDDLVQLAGAWTVVMELLAGANLHQIVRATGALPLGVGLEVAHVVAGALHAAHDRPGPGGEPLRVLHRDIKPSNIQLTPLGEVKVLDFGVARASFDTREAATRSLIFGSVGYMAPERMAGRDSHAGDVYALGVVLYEILAGKRLGTACSKPNLQATLVGDALDALAETQPDKDLEALLLSALAFDPEARPRADVFQRTARRIRARHPEPWLSDWTDNVLPKVMQIQEQSTGPLSGRTLREHGPGGPGGRDRSGPAPEPERQHGGTGFTPPAFEPSAPHTPTAAHSPARNDEIPSEPIGLPPLPKPKGRTPAPTPAPTRPRPSPSPEPEHAPAEPNTTQFERVQTPVSAKTPPAPLQEAETGMDKPATEPPEPPPPSPVPPKRRRGLPILGGVAALLTLAAGLALFFGPFRDDQQASPEPAEESVPADAEATDPPQPAPVVGEPEPEHPEQTPRPQTRAGENTPSARALPAASGPSDPMVAAPRPKPTEPSVPTTAPPPAPEPNPAMAAVTLVGDATTVALTNDSASYGPGEVPPGDYVIHASFPGLDGTLEAGRLHLDAGQVVWLECVSGFDRCAPVPVGGS